MRSSLCPVRRGRSPARRTVRGQPALVYANSRGRRARLTPRATRTSLSAVIALRWGQPAPAFSLPSTLGRPVSLAEQLGKDVVLAFYCYDWGNI